MARRSDSPFASFTGIDPSQGVSGVIDQIKNQAILPNVGLFGAKRQRLLFTDLKSLESGKALFGKKKNQQLRYPDVEVYADPQRIRVDKKVMVSKTLTKGGWISQFWGHDLPVISINALSGYYGITKGRRPAISKIMDTYSRTEGRDIKKWNSSDFLQPPPNKAVDPLKIFEKLKKYAFDKRFDGDLPHKGVPIITMVYEGTAYKGYFNNFTYSLDANKPFVISYNFRFTVISDPEAIRGLQRLIKSRGVTAAASAFGTGMNQGIANTVAGGVKSLSNAAVSTASKFATDAINSVGKRIGIKDAVDNTPSKIILA